MADNLQLNLGTGGGVLNTDQLADGSHAQRIKLLSGVADSTQVIEAGNGVHGAAIRVTVASDSTGQVKLAAGSAVVGEVSIGAATTAAGDLAKAEGSAHSSGDTGVGIWGVQKAAPTNLGSDGQYAPPQFSNGHMWTYSVGSIAHDAADSGNPLKIGAKAKNTDGTDPGVVAENDRTDLYSDRNGRIFTSSTHPRGFQVSADYGASAQTNTTVQAAPGSGVSLYITDICISNGPSAVNNVTLLDGSGGTVLFETYLAINSNMVSNLRQPIKLTANTLLAITSTGASEMSVNIAGYTAE